MEGRGGGRILWQVCLCDRCYIAVVCSVADSAEEVGDLFSVTVLLAVQRTPPSLLQMLTVRLEELDYSSAWVLASRSGLSDINTDLNRELMTHWHMYTRTQYSSHFAPPSAPPSNLLVNLGALMLRALYEHWSGAYINQTSSEEGGREGRQGGLDEWRGIVRRARRVWKM